MDTESSPPNLKRAPSIPTTELQPDIKFKRLRQDRLDSTVDPELVREFRSCVNALLTSNITDTLASLRERGGGVERQAAAIEHLLIALRTLKTPDGLLFDTKWDEGLTLPFDSPLLLAEIPVETSALLTRLETLRKLITTAQFPLTASSSVGDDPMQDLPFGDKDILVSATSTCSNQPKESIVAISIRGRGYGRGGPSILTLDPAFCLFFVLNNTVSPAEKDRNEDQIGAWGVASILAGTMGEIYPDGSGHWGHSSTRYSYLCEDDLAASVPEPMPLGSFSIPRDFRPTDKNKRRVAFMYALDGFLPLQWRTDAVILNGHKEGRFDVIFSDDDKSYYLAIRIDTEMPVGVNPDKQLGCMYDLFLISSVDHSTGLPYQAAQCSLLQ
ncbi:hypothetical protein GALMADRAFT_442645 [Galerina marginata CBS 339.88]|uniref:Uncharacterized protein n=1 Tax=Galerina marginata (strain CBS 339.88) TaxID=685588 RepID=A0A067T2F7_GALM3|nr:hypothetical protein GALMADRAFT_442645 [Galerina marginata CBS 339.88]